MVLESEGSSAGMVPENECSTAGRVAESELGGGGGGCREECRKAKLWSAESVSDA